MTPPDAPAGTERHKVTKEDALKDLFMMTPEAYAGEGLSDPEEIARSSDVSNNPLLSALVEGGGLEHWPIKGKKR